MGICQSKGPQGQTTAAAPEIIIGPLKARVREQPGSPDKSPVKSGRSESRRPTLSAAAAAAAASGASPHGDYSPSRSPGAGSPYARTPGGYASPKTPYSRKERKSDTIKSSQFILSNPGKVEEVYTMEAKYGQGTYGEVRQGTHIVTKKVRAIKKIKKSGLKSIDKFKREVDIMKMMDHPNIIKLFETFEDKEHVYLAMEMCSGGELFERIIEAQRFTEKEAAIVVQQITRGVFYMHEIGVAHRDLKPENFLFATKDAIERSSLKIIDFGLSATFTAGQVLSTRAGTPYYVAPQVLSSKYDHKCDLWSIGVITYILLCGYPPFYGRNDHEVLAKVKKGLYSFEPKDWSRVSSDAKNLIRKLLCYDPKDRFTAEQALHHTWICQLAPRATGVSLKSQPALIDNLRSFSSQNKLKKAALQIIAGQLDESQIKGLRETFTLLDSNGDGLLTMDELKAGLDHAGYRKTNSDLEDMMEGMDTDGSGVIDYTEFLAAALDRRQHISEQAVWTAFKVFDLDNDNRITLEELRQVLNQGELGDRFCTSAEDILREVDKNGDGTIDFQEFMLMMHGDARGRSTRSLASPAALEC